MKPNLLEFEIVDPQTSITKIGAGANLFMIAERGNMVEILPAGSLPLLDVVEISKAGYKFIEVKR